MSLPPGVTITMLIDAAMRDDGVGFCTTCGEESEGFVEPDASEYHCVLCDTHTVFGAEELVLMNVA